MPQRTFVLLGGGDLRAKETLPLDKKIAELARPHAGEKRPCALFIGTASHDFMPSYNTFHQTYTGELGWKTDVALTVFHEPDPAKLDAKFAAADLIYIGGGDTVFMLEHWKADGLLDRILAAYQRGVVVAGLSAGAICWFENMYTDSSIDGVPTPYSFHKGLGILKGGACPHYNLRRDDFLAACPEADRKNWLCLADNAAAVYRNEEFAEIW